MTRIGFAYNQKPDASTETEGRNHVPSESSAPFDDEPPSFSRQAIVTTRESIALAVQRTPSVPRADDAYAEWDSPETIAAVERALSGLGEVVRLEANADFPQKLRETRP